MFAFTCLCPSLTAKLSPSLSSSHSSSVVPLTRQQIPSLNPHIVMSVPAPATSPSLPLSPSLLAPQMSPPFSPPSPASLVHQPISPPFPLQSAIRTTAGARQFPPVTSRPTSWVSPWPTSLSPFLTTILTSATRTLSDEGLYGLSKGNQILVHSPRWKSLTSASRSSPRSSNSVCPVL